MGVVVDTFNPRPVQVSSKPAWSTQEFQDNQGQVERSYPQKTNKEEKKITFLESKNLEVRRIHMKAKMSPGKKNSL